MYQRRLIPPIPGIIPRMVVGSTTLSGFAAFRDGHSAPGFPLHAPGKLFCIPEVFGIGLSLVETPEIL